MSRSRADACIWKWSVNSALRWCRFRSRNCWLAALEIARWPSPPTPAGPSIASRSITADVKSRPFACRVRSFEVRSETWDPAWHAPSIGLVLLAEHPSQRGLLVQQNENVESQPEKGRILHQRSRPEQQGLTPHDQQHA